jgi:predicted DCC family thiol-disulfide oxidoreductase YuxK
MSKTKVYYNSACPVCDAGIRSQKGRLDTCGAQIEWVDVHASTEAASEVCSDLEFVRERLHVRDEAGNLHVGWDAFAELWNQTPGQRGLAAVARVPGLRSVFRWSYNRFAALLYRWNRWHRRW